MATLSIVDAGDHDALASALRDSGACLLSGFPSTDASAALREDLLRLRDDGSMQPAAVGRGGGRTHRDRIRGDRTLWLDDPRCGTAAAGYLQALEVLRSELNRRLFLGLRSLEAHYAAYPSGARYARHRDRFRDSDARVLSLVSYLNRDWRNSDGGALRLYLEDAAVDVRPATGTSICFLSELEHEVLPATRERLSIAAWMRREPG